MSDDAATAPPPVKRTLTPSGLLVALAWVALFPTWLGGLGRYHWLLDLMSHFRLQLLLAAVVVLAFAAQRRLMVLLLAAVLSLLWNAQLISSVHRTAELPAGVVTAPTKPLRVLTLNVLGINTNHVEVVNHILQVDADIVCLPEARADWRIDLEPLRVHYPYRVEELEDGDFSLACYTRLPVKSSGVRRLAYWRLPTIILNLDDRGTPLTFIATHPHPPTSAEYARGWKEQLSQIGDLVAELEGNVIVAGDFNATPWCEGMRLLFAKSGLGFRSAVPVWPPTWGLRLPFMIPIDHVVSKGNLVVQRRVIGPDVGSDHRSVLVEMVR